MKDFLSGDGGMIAAFLMELLAQDSPLLTASSLNRQLTSTTAQSILSVQCGRLFPEQSGTFSAAELIEALPSKAITVKHICKNHLNVMLPTKQSLFLM